MIHICRRAARLITSGAFYDNVILVAKTITLNQSKNVFGFSDS
jgi:hypothetical protein